jgi:murein DD-endopeptidase MepM/ murein hydrolase activator NlpD
MSFRATTSLYATALLIAAGLTFVAWRQIQREEPRRVRFEGAQVSADPLSMPPEGSPDMRFRLLSPWETAVTPIASRFDPPLGALVYNAQPFWEMNVRRGGHHTGDDLNGIGGMNTDLGDAVFAVADGLVVYAGDPSPGWGNIVILAHRRPNGELVQSMYAHLDRIDVSPGELVARGGRVGRVGTAHGSYPAHLHFEIRTGDGVDIGAGYGGDPLNRVDPGKALFEWRGAAADDFTPAPLGIALREGK